MSEGASIGVPLTFFIYIYLFFLNKFFPLFHRSHEFQFVVAEIFKNFRFAPLIEPK